MTLHSSSGSALESFAAGLSWASRSEQFPGIRPGNIQPKATNSKHSKRRESITTGSLVNGEREITSVNLSGRRRGVENLTGTNLVQLGNDCVLEGWPNPFF